MKPTKIQIKEKLFKINNESISFHISSSNLLLFQFSRELRVCFCFLFLFYFLIKIRRNADSSLYFQLQINRKYILYMLLSLSLYWVLAQVSRNYEEMTSSWKRKKSDVFWEKNLPQALLVSFCFPLDWSQVLYNYGMIFIVEFLTLEHRVGFQPLKGVVSIVWYERLLRIVSLSSCRRTELRS